MLENLKYEVFPIIKNQKPVKRNFSEMKDIALGDSGSESERTNNKLDDDYSIKARRIRNIER